MIFARIGYGLPHLQSYNQDPQGRLVAHGTETPPSRQSQRQQDCESLIRAATARPDTRELMRVYETWKQADRDLEPYRAISRNQVVTTTTNNTTKLPALSVT